MDYSHLRVPFGLQLDTTNLFQWNHPLKKSRKSKIKNNKTLKFK